MATYVIGDIHGQLEQLKVLLEKMKFNENDRTVCDGGMSWTVDRSHQSIAVSDDAAKLCMYRRKS